MDSLKLKNIDNSRVYRPTVNAWSNDKQRFRPPDIRPIVPVGQVCPNHYNRRVLCDLVESLQLNLIRLEGDWNDMTGLLVFQDNRRSKLAGTCIILDKQKRKLL